MALPKKGLQVTSPSRQAAILAATKAAQSYWPDLNSPSGVDARHDFIQGFEAGWSARDGEIEKLREALRAVVEDASEPDLLNGIGAFINAEVLAQAREALKTESGGS